MIAAHADWSVNPGKRWFTGARRTGPGGWLATAPRPVGEPAAWAAALLAEGPTVALGLDLPLGLPRAYARARPEPDFPAFLRGLARQPGFWRVAETVAEVSAGSPFYPARGMRGMTRLEHALALGMADASGLCRLCDLATAERPAGAPLFWTLGANQTGKAAISAWRDWLVPALSAGAPYRLWPFEGGLHGLLAPGRAVLAEVYPAECLRHLGLRLSGSKRDRTVRLRVLPELREAMARLGVRPDAPLAEAMADGFGADAAGEDRFDSLLGLLGLIGVLDGIRPDFVPDDPWVRHWEGWVLGQTSLPAAPPYPAGV
ncbi:Methyltransferase [Roseomonas mucosa]|uniref:DUF429 domain-containing protein n=2 Tax=Roseomonas mucosa TaxID=207340 RepID=A0A1S8D8X1_9PROT|nr:MULTISPECIES: hypothetical protein [Roseomonas]MBS5901619.1 hypothetical protein [Acetobacteraceae bacterium]ATR19971.1 hypothetical protein CTJ15_06420 [Roseomonas sp. FDAARGOS_362]MCG7354041.1 hypothetical protein [Roseomonas mucosa]MCG7359150.1 hypothetical protein [Roseomonas mucosa]MDT8288789.1 hypothetical protein [Roseomonas mucosa]